jgi:tetratricopeptide (TPR) repeat protein
MIDEIEIPSSVLDLVNARVADLTEEERDLLDVACCWGYEFDPVIVAEACGLSRVPALKRLGQIERRHRLVRSHGRRYCFDHHQVQEALYGGLNEYLREEYHASLADALETRTRAADKEPAELDGALCMDLCEHYLKGARGESALRYFWSAQKHLANCYQHAEMVALTERALAVPDLLVGAERAKTLLRLSRSLDPLGRRTHQEECVREAGRLAGAAGDDELRGKAERALGRFLSVTSRQTEAEAAVRRALEIAVARGDQGTEALATGNLGTVLQAQGRLPEAQELQERSLALARETGDRSAESTATLNLGSVLLSQDRLPEALEYFERSLVLCRELSDRQSEAVVMGNLGTLFFSQGRLVEAQEQHERHLALTREIGYREGEAVALHNLGGVLQEEGESARAEECLLACVAVSEEIGFRDAVASARFMIGSQRAAAGDLEGGRASLAAAQELAAEIGSAACETYARCELACLPGGDAADALAAFAAHEERLSPGERLATRRMLWRATGDRSHLEEAKRLVDVSVAHVDAETRESMLTNLRVNREVMAAWERRG